MAIETVKKNRKYYTHVVLYFLILFSGWFLPTVGNITPLGMRVLGVFLGVLYGWIFIGFIWPSFGAMIALGLTGYETVLEVFQNGMGDATVLKVFFIFVFAGFLQATDLTTFIAQWCISRKICRGKPWLLISVLFFAAIIVGGFINQYAAVVIIWCIFYGICKATGLEKGDALVSYVVVGVPVMSTMGAMLMPFLPVAIIFRSMLQESILNEYPAPMGELTVAHLLLTMTLVVGYILVGKYVLRIKTDALLNLDDEYFAAIENQKMNSEQKICMWALVTFVVMLVAPILLPEGLFKELLTNLDLVGAAIIMIMFFLIRKSAKGESIYDFGKMVTTGIDWNIIIIFAAIAPISGALSSDATGIVNTVVAGLMPVFQSISPSLYLAACFIIFLLITQVASNLVLGIVFTSVLAKIGIDMGINPYLFQIFFAWSLQLAFITPGASANSALIFANSAWIDTKQAYKYTTVAVVTGTVLAMALLPVLLKVFD